MSGPVTFVRLGTKYRFFKTHPNRWSDGKVHLERWSKQHRQWVLLCKPSDEGVGFAGYYGAELDHAEELTCRSCRKYDPRLR